MVYVADSEQLQQGSLMPIQNDGQEAEAVATKNHVVSDKLQHQEGIYKHLEMGSSITATGKLFHTLQMESGNTSSCVSREMKEPEQHVSAPVVAAPVFAGGEDTAVGSSQSNASYYESMANDVTMWMTSTFGKFLDSEEHLTGNEDTNLGSKN
ncbi:uncharacterized protein LOC126184251 [Schistocerca cancellata]|uniref:uncharacterized protein LOC126184251 n=1 Tax=Schistocerca cancellata TaxID=274614 RepID=UPI0021199A85|nr:uncharacterized protein LOC126184251 [Schistocerca cancellata]